MWPSGFNQKLYSAIDFRPAAPGKKEEKKKILIFKMIFRIYQALQILENFAVLFYSVHQQKGDVFQPEGKFKGVETAIFWCL